MVKKYKNWLFISKEGVPVKVSCRKCSKIPQNLKPINNNHGLFRKCRRLFSPKLKVKDTQSVDHLQKRKKNNLVWWVEVWKMENHTGYRTQLELVNADLTEVCLNRVKLVGFLKTLKSCVFHFLSKNTINVFPSIINLISCRFDWTFSVSTKQLSMVPFCSWRCSWKKKKKKRFKWEKQRTHCDFSVTFRVNVQQQNILWQ